ncbi:PucR family transcriptional regulator [Actinophytocola xinjiangensis]|uniref:PucR family transcriptional regulator n=1 Tax=Actinophytocola xinjiangensis TaxID=485602 RepID=UPI0009FCFC74|nr:helix-turn-helix domain-containing protein [Actinophytocola xinjiangensis]
MAEEVQRIVEDLAVRIGRPVLLEDPGQRVVAYSEQTGPMDDLRRDSILRRHTSDAARTHFRAAGIFDARGPLRIPASGGVLARVCVPARHRDRLLGFVWLIDDAPPMTDEQVRVAAGAAPALALTLFRDSLAAGLGYRRELEAVSRLLFGEQGTARAAARLLTEAGGFPVSSPVTAVVLRPAGREPVEEAVLAARFTLAARQPLHHVRHDHGVLLCAGTPPVAEVRSALGQGLVAGVGRPRPALTEAARSYREAVHAALVAARVPGHGPVAAWPELGVYRMLAGVPAGELHPGLERLLADQAHRPLLDTLETYLDLAGSVAATARALRLHRTSLYYRLQRVEELAGTDLRSGDERLTLHLGLKLARLSGRLD